MVNKVLLIGHLGADPEIRYMPSGDAVTTIRLATTDRYRDKASGEMREATEWHRVVFFRRLAEVVNEYQKKGSEIYIEGRIRTRKWQDSGGQDRYSTEIVADQMKMFGRPRGSGDAPAASRSPAAAGAARGDAQPGGNTGGDSDGGYSGFDDMPDDIPF